MASGKILRQLIKTGTEGNLEAFRQISEEVIREEREKQHHLLANDLEKILYGRANKATKKEDYQNIPEVSGAEPSATLRSKGTVQVARWRWRQFNRNSILCRKRLFIVVTRNDHFWAELSSAAEENYALVVCLRDQENERACFCTTLRERYRLRSRPRVRVRV